MEGQFIGIIAPVAAALAAVVAITYNARRLSRLANRDQDERIRHIINEVRRPTSVCRATFFDKERGAKIETQVERLQVTTDSGFHDMRTRLDELRDMMNGGAK